MATLFRIEHDYSTNKAPRIPICICVDTSNEVSADVVKEMNSVLQMINEYINDNSELKAKVQLCVLSFGEKTTVVSDFAAVSNEACRLPTVGGEPKLALALNKFLELIIARVRLYRSENISHYLPQLLVLSSGKSATDITEVAKRLNLAQLSNKLCVLPFLITDNDSSLLNTLTDDGFVDPDYTNFEAVFNCLKSGLEILSTSSASAGKTLKSNAETFTNQFNKR